MTATITTIIVYTSAPDAVRTASEYGWHNLHVDLSAWTEDERSELAGLVRDDRGARLDEKIVVAPPTPERLREIIVARLAQAEQREQARRAAAEQEAERIAELERRDRIAAERWAALPLSFRATSHGVAYCRPSSSTPDYAGPLACSGYSIINRDDLRKYATAAYAEAEAEVERLRAVEAVEAAKEEAARAARVREILLMHAVDLVDVYDAGMARREDIDAAMITWACAELGIDSFVLTDRRHVRDLDAIDPQHYRALIRTRTAVVRLGDPKVEVAAAIGYEDEDEDSELLVVVRADVAGWRVYLEIPIEHTPR